MKIFFLILHLYPYIWGQMSSYVPPTMFGITILLDHILVMTLCIVMGNRLYCQPTGAMMVGYKAMNGP